MNSCHRIRHLALLVIFLLTVRYVSAETEGQIARTAEKHFIAKQYTKAAPLYAQLVSSNPKNYKYNYYYGICLLITGKDKNQALPYLEMAMQNPKTPEDIYYYMGRALHLTYNFEPAIKSFVEFNTIIGAKNAPKWQTPQMIGMLNNAIQILDTTRNELIQSFTDVSAGDFYKQYEFENPNGKLLSMPDEVIKKSNSENDIRPMIFLSANNRVMYYSAVSPETSSRDIYRVEKDLDGNWGAPERIPNIVNTTQDELYPTCNADGRILYFSSRGHNSTGGFDVFKAYYNTVSKTFTKPENMGSPINSPDDDFCFVASAEESSAYFTSQRATGPGEFTVYKMKYANTEELPVAINGRFSCIGQPEIKEATLTITRTGDTTTVASITTDQNTGTYSLELPGPGTYTFKVEVPGFSAHSQDVTFGEFSDNIFVQDIMLSRNYNGVENLAVSSRRLSDSDKIDASLVVNNGESEDGTTGGGITSHDVEATARTTSAGSNSMETVTVNDKVQVPAMPGVNFKVQIGAFKKYKRDVVQQRLAKKTDASQLSDYKDSEWLRFYMGNEKTLTSAKNLRTTLVHAGFKDAFVVAFDGQKPMLLQEAIQRTTAK